MEEGSAPPERSTAQNPVDEDTGSPRSKEGTHPTRISDMWDAVTPTGSTSNGSKLTARKAQFPGGKRKNQEAKAASRKARENHNPADRAIKEDGETQIERLQTWFW
jgi:hypothetical protein